MLQSVCHHVGRTFLFFFLFLSFCSSFLKVLNQKSFNKKYPKLKAFFFVFFKVKKKRKKKHRGSVFFKIFL